MSEQVTHSGLSVKGWQLNILNIYYKDIILNEVKYIAITILFKE